jgi:hypothetical protein
MKRQRVAIRIVWVRLFEHRRTVGQAHRVRIAEAPHAGHRAEVPGAQQFCIRKVGLSYIPPGTPRNNGYIDRSTTGDGTSASTATTGRVCLKPT